LGTFDLRRFIAVCLAGFVTVLAASGCGDSSAQNAAPAGAAGAGSGGAAGASGGRAGGGRRGGSAGAQPVVVTKVTQQDVPVDIAAVGNVEAFTSVSVRSQVTGQLQEAFFKEGDVVTKGQKLFAIDPRPLQATLDQAVANQLRDQALLNQANAQLARDQANAKFLKASSDRQAELLVKGLVSKEAAEQSRTAADAALETVKADTAAVESAKAQAVVQDAVVDNAKVQLSYTTIRSTIDGRTGSNTVKPGNLVQANSTELVTVSQLQPVFVTFSVPAVHLPTIKHHSPADPMLVSATPQDGNADAVQGKLTFVDNVIDTTTDTIKLKASFDNKDLRLWPGQFTRVTLRLSTLSQATVIPSVAVQVGQDGQFVFVVKQDMTVEQRPITVAQRFGEIVVVGKGLTPGETVVTEGQLRLEHGTKVQPTDTNGTSSGGRRGGGGGGRGGGGRGQQGGGSPTPTPPGGAANGRGGN
jgi:multidrug efflux system membrane fusion protein